MEDIKDESAAHYGDVLRHWSRAVSGAKNPETSINLYNKWAGTYDQDYEYKRSLRTRPADVAVELDRFLESRKDAKILDLGTGTGLVAVELAKLGYHNVDGIDSSPGMLAKARSKNVHVKLIEARIGPERMPIGNDIYDALVGVSCFGDGHIPASSFNDFFRVLKPGGFLAVVIRETEMADYDAEVERLERENKGRCLLRREIDPTYVHGPGVLSITQKC